MDLTIIHLTDLHANNHIEFFQEKVNDIADKILQADSENILLLFSGDITFSGKKEQFILARSFVEEIKKKAKKKIYFASCPGNHDRLFEDDEKIEISDFEKKSSEVYFSLKEKHQNLCKQYKDFVVNDSHFKKINDILDYYDFTFSGFKVRVISLNNSLLSFFNDSQTNIDSNYENIFIPDELLDIKRNNVDFCILLMHMPISYLEGRTKKLLIERCNKNVDIVIDGHVHVDNILMESGPRKFLEFTSSALYSNDASGFTKFDINSNVIRYSNFFFDALKNKYSKQNDGEQCSISFAKKLSTIDNIQVNLDHIDNGSIYTTISKIDINIDDTFVFPLLSSEYTKNNKTTYVTKWDDFKNYVMNCRIVQLSSEDDMGKTTLANRLFHLYISEGYAPVLCIGNDFSRFFSKPSNFNFCVNNQIKNNYLGENIVDTYFASDNNGKRVLIVDDFDCFTESLIESLLLKFDKIIFFVSSKIKDLISFSSFNGANCCKLLIEPMYKIKRLELFEKVYAVVKRVRENLGETISKEEYINTFEDQLSVLDKNNMMDPGAIIELSTRILLQVKRFENVNSLHYQNFYFDQIIEEQIELHNITNCSLVVANRILDRVAYFCYEQESNSFNVELVEKAVLEEKDVYGGDIFDNIKKFVLAMCDAKILFELDYNSYRFFKRKTFAYFVGRHVMRVYSYDHHPLNLIISRGVYSPLNYNILMSIASNNSIESIPSYFVDDLYKDIMSIEIEYPLKLKSITSFFKEDKKRLINISDDEKNRIKSKSSKREEINRKHYLENIDNFYYVDKMSEQTKELIDLINKMKIISSLTYSSDYIKKEEKNKLANLVVRIPNVIIDKYVYLTKKQIDEIFVTMEDDINKDKTLTQSEIDEVFDLLISLMTSFILTIYDISSRYLGISNIRSDIYKLLSNNKTEVTNNIIAVQRLMLLSFTNKDKFTTEIVDFIEKCNNNFYTNQARLIARRFYFEHKDYVIRHKKDFLNVIGGFSNMNKMENKKKLIGK